MENQASHLDNTKEEKIKRKRLGVKGGGEASN